MYLPSGSRRKRNMPGLCSRRYRETKIGLLDLLKIYPVKNEAQLNEVIQSLEPIVPRLYSISSSPEAHPGEIHLTVARDEFMVNGEIHHGLCSEFLTKLPVDVELPFYIHKNNQFRLPLDDQKDIIMIGPGTWDCSLSVVHCRKRCYRCNGQKLAFFG